MIVTHEREKLLHAIIFFVSNTAYCGKIKLFKLLFFLDFEHFKATGRSVTGLEYLAWDKGPAPEALYRELANPPPDMIDAMTIGEIPVKNGAMLKIDPKIPFSNEHFTRREIAIMQSLAAKYKTTLADGMIEETHLENKPWDVIYNQNQNRSGVIPYRLAARRDESDLIMSISNDRAELIEKLG